MAVKYTKSAFNILEAALELIDLSQINDDDLDNFELSKKPSMLWQMSQYERYLSTTIERRVPPKTKQTTKWAHSVWCS